MATSEEILRHLIEEGTAATAHFQVWWALRNRALPEFHSTMIDIEYVEFFHAANSGHYKLVFVALGKIFDSDTRAAGVAQLKTALRAEGKGDIAARLEQHLAPITGVIGRVLAIRNRSLVHNEHAVTRKKVYEMNGITANEIRRAISVTSAALNEVAAALGESSRITTSERFENATLKMLSRLRGSGA